MDSCTLNLLTILAAAFGAVASIVAVYYLEQTYYKVREFLRNLDIAPILAPVAGAALVAALVFTMTPKVIEVTDCATGKKVQSIAFDHFICKGKS